jgi:3-oxoacyl-[acyl-carrier-protein] synthase II
VSRRRVVITGLGAVTPLGHSVAATWEGLTAGRSGAAPVTRFDTTGFLVTFGAEVKNFNPADFIDPKVAGRLDPFSQFALAAAEEAVRDGGLDFAKLERPRCGAIVGSGIGGLTEIEDQHTRLREKGPQRLSPLFIPKLMVNAASANVAIRFGLAGGNFSTSSACASANHAMGMALREIRLDEADLVLTGGAEAALTPLGLAGFACMKALSRRNDAPQKASRPLDKDRDGFVLGEGAGVLVFEELEHARRRGAKIYAEVLGFGHSDDAYHITAPDPDGAGGTLAMVRAIRDAELKPADIGYVNAHGTSTELNDKIETMALKLALGEAHARKIPINSSKSMIGHLLGAAAAVELVATVLTLVKGLAHPTINYETPDPACDLDYVPNTARRIDAVFGMSNSLGFGGHNSAIVVGRYPR